MRDVLDLRKGKAELSKILVRDSIKKARDFLTKLVSQIWSIGFYLSLFAFILVWPGIYLTLSGFFTIGLYCLETEMYDLRLMREC